MYAFLGISQALKVNIGFLLVVSNCLQIRSDNESEYLVSKREERQKYLNCEPLKTLGNKTPSEEGRS